MTTTVAVARDVEDVGKLGMTVGNTDGVAEGGLGSSWKTGVGTFEILRDPEDGIDMTRERPPVVL